MFILFSFAKLQCLMMQRQNTDIFQMRPLLNSDLFVLSFLYLGLILGLSLNPSPNILTLVSFLRSL